MKRVAFGLSTFVVASALVVAPISAPPAAAATPSAHMIVGFQEAGTSCAATNSRVVVVNANVPAGQAATQVANLGKPTGMVGVINEVKPFDNNNKVVALWARTSSGDGGVGVFTRTSGYSGSWAQPVTFDNDVVGVDFGTNGGAHSVTVMPGGYFAVAHVGVVPGWSGAGHVVVFSPTGAIIDHETVESAHGVEWDEKRGLLFAAGYKDVRSFTVDPATHKISLRSTWLFPPTADGKAPGGHDLRRRRMTDDYYVTTNAKTYKFDPEASAGTEFTTVTKTSGSSLPGGVKTVDEGFDGVVEYGQWEVGKFFYLDGREITGPSCMRPYKQRWIWGMNTPVFPEDAPGTPTPPPATGSADPFIYNTELLRSNQPSLPIGDTIWAGHASWDSKTGVAGEIRKQICAGITPYILFYHWGDGNEEPDEGEVWRRKMSNVEHASQGEVDDWVGFATAIAQAIDNAARDCEKPENAYIAIEHEWDVDVVGAACSWQFETGLQRVVDEFNKYVPDTTLVNSPGLYKPDSDYNCFDKEHLYDQHGFGLFEVNATQDCTRKYDGTYYKASKYTLADVDIVKDVQNNADKLNRLFGAQEVLLTDLAVTSCGWGASGQASIFQDLSDALAMLYDTKGLRGVVMRDGGPGDHKERATGVNNEGGFFWTSPSATADAIASGRSQIQAHLNSIGSQPTVREFTSSVVASPANIALGATTRITTTVTAKQGGVTNGHVAVEVYDGATRVHQQPYNGVTMAPGDTRNFAFDWTPTAAASYRVKVGVFSTGWADTYHWNDNAATIVVSATGGDPTFTSSATASPSTVSTGATTTITATVTNNGGALSNGTVEIGVYSPTADPVDAEIFTGHNIAAGAQQQYQMSWTAPVTAGTYTIRVRVTGAGGSPEYHLNGGAGSITVTSNKFTSTVTLSRATVAPENATTITATIENVGSSLSNGIVDIEVYGPTGSRVAQQSWSGQSIAAGASATYSYVWTAPTTPTGTYTVKVGVFGAGWEPTLHWNSRAATIGVTVPSFVVDASSSPTKVGPGGTTNVTVTVTTEGGSLENAVVDLEIFNSAGTRMVQKGWTGQSLVNGTTTALTYAWTVPTTLGTYTAKAGVMGPGWTPTYKWNNNADTITVANPSFTSAATVSRSSVTPGQPVDITATWTATGGSVTNSRFQIVVDKPDGTRLFDEDWVEALADGHSLTKTYTWTTPLSPTGTYKVRLGVFSNDWDDTQHWNGTAATVSVGSTFQPSFQVGDGASNWWIEVYTSSDVTAVDVIGKDGAFYMSLQKKWWGAWAGTAPSSVSSGDLMRFVARRSTDGATAGSNNFAWLNAAPTTDPGWICAFAIGAGASTSRVEVIASPSATAVEVKVNSGAFTALTKDPVTGVWAKSMSAPAGAKVVFRATNASGARAYSTFYNWLQ